MNVLVLGGCGIQGRAALYDLSHDAGIRRVVCADVAADSIRQVDYLQQDKIEAVALDAANASELRAVMQRDVDVVIDLLPITFMQQAVAAAIDSGISLVTTNYAYTIQPLHDRARARGVTIMAECGLDPGIDLVIYGHAARQFDTLEVLNSYCGGLPEISACDNPLNYKISWNWETVLQTQQREGVLVKDGQVVVVAPAQQHDNPFIHEIAFEGVGQLEAYPNGNAVHFTDLLGITPHIRETGRYSLRRPGWCAFWRPLKQLGCLSDTPVEGAAGVSPRQFFTRWLEPQLQYAPHEKDLAVMHNMFVGVRDGRRHKRTYNVLIERDLKTGLMGMALGVSYPACIVARMIVAGQVADKGVVSPVTSVPYEPFMAALEQRGIVVQATSEALDA